MGRRDMQVGSIVVRFGLVGAYDSLCSMRCSIASRQKRENDGASALVALFDGLTCARYYYSSSALWRLPTERSCDPRVTECE